MNLADCLPAELRTAQITRIAAGLSGAGVYRVDADGRAYVLKIAAGDDPGWPERVAVQRAAAAAGVAPGVIHVDTERRAVVSELVVDRSLPALYGNPATRSAAVELLGRTLRRVHDLPTTMPARDTVALFDHFVAHTAAIVPRFVADAVARVRAEPVPDAGRPAVLSHNDVNPSNLAYDGERVVLLDWDTVGANEPYWDLATIATFLRMDDATCLQLLAAHDGTAPTVLPPRFVYDRRFVAVICGVAFIYLAHQLGHGGGEAAPMPLADFYQKLRARELDITTAEGRWQFGLALVASAGN